MILCLDVGNSQIHGGVFEDDKLLIQFRRNSRGGGSSDEYGLFLRSVLRENGVDPDAIDRISLCTVVPETLHSLKNCCLKYFHKNPFILQAGVKTGLKINYRNPVEVGADRIANAIAASDLYPGQDLLIIDFGTATTFCAISATRQYLGGVILAGLRISMESLESRTSKLPSVEILRPKECLGRSTVESIQSGLYFGAIGMIKEITSRLTKEAFEGRRPKVIATGGFSSLLDNEKLFDVEIPDLVLRGLNLSLKMNT
ncbi:MAG: type III pantothenate kinase [Bdellovibrionaceae bacterium]|nr:type III pantothenate kinase [Bdellovibrionales bacterium]MCB9086300.1 type III pantothenate kinase [Pseudobdellovibrionaceae bacterium]